MNKLILCEGKTDAILLSYYLERTCGWEYSKGAPKGLNIKADKMIGESAEWYQKGTDFLLICAVGSKTRFKAFFNDKINNPLLDADAFSRIALMIDRDDESIATIEECIRTDIPIAAKKAVNECWIKHDYCNSFGECKQLDFLLLAIPHEQQGALETLLLEAISEDPYNKNIVDKSKVYVDEIAPEARRYIGKRGLILKAYLGVTWAIQSPQKVFDFIHEQICMVEWEKSAVLCECFASIREI